MVVKKKTFFFFLLVLLLFFIIPELNILRIQIADFLNTIIFENSFVFIDYWTALHWLTGIILIQILIQRGTKNPFFVLFLLVVGWEIFEVTIGLPYFIGESKINIAWDIIYAMKAAWLYVRFKR